MPPTVAVSYYTRVEYLSGKPYLNLLLELLLEATPNDLPLAGFKAVANGRDGANIVRHREKNELLVDEIGVRNLVRIVVKIGSGLTVFNE